MEEDMPINVINMEDDETSSMLQTPNDLLVSDKFSWKTLWAFTGPGFLMSIAYLDPGNIEADLQVGAVGGYTLLWVLLWATVVGWLLQQQAIILGMTSGKDLAQVCRQEYSLVPKVIVFLMTELVIIGSDIQEVIGSAIALNILSLGAIPLWGGVLITVADTFTFLLLERYGVRHLEAFFGLLIAIMALMFGIEMGIAQPSAVDILKGTFVPYLPRDLTTVAVSLLGAVIMPHNIYLHSSLVQSRRVNSASVQEVKNGVFYSSLEAAIALSVSFLINLFVVSVFAEGFYGTIADESDIGLENAGFYLKETFGTVSLFIWAVGILAAGQSSTMTGTYAGQFVMRGFWEFSIPPWQQVLITRLLAILPALSVCFLADPCDYATGCVDDDSSGNVNNSLDLMNLYINVMQSIQLPFALLPLITFTSDPKIMRTYQNAPWKTILIWFFAFLLILINFYQCSIFLEMLPDNIVIWIFVSFVVLLYTAFVIYLLIGPNFRNVEMAKRIFTEISQSIREYTNTSS